MIWMSRLSWRYYQTSRVAHGLDPSSDPTESIRFVGEHLSDSYLHQQDDPARESLRVRCWVVFGMLGVMVMFGLQLVAAILSWFGL
jgi:hypothetical protein